MKFSFPTEEIERKNPPDTETHRKSEPAEDSFATDKEVRQASKKILKRNQKVYKELAK